MQGRLNSIIGPGQSSALESMAYEKGVQPVHWSGARRTKKGPVNL